MLNVVPFSPFHHERILTFSEQVNTAFQPKPSGSRNVIRVFSAAPASTFVAAFEEFRKLYRGTGQNQAAFGISEGQDPVEFYFSTVWSAIRAGWRDGYALHSPIPVAPVPGVRRRPFESKLHIVREVVLSAGITRDQIAAQF